MKNIFLSFAIILLILSFIAGCTSSQSSNSTDNSPVRIIKIKAMRFQFDPNVITIKKGEHIKIVIDSVDTTHGISIPAFGVSGIDSVEFTADKAGTFEFRCPTPCGPGHSQMKGTIIVTE